MHHSRVECPHGFVGHSPQIRSIRRQIEQIGTSLSSVLILGESGTGKEVVARSLHNANPRGAFIPIDCGSLVGPLMESELFGHVRGAFTGANDNKRGLIELADQGTAFFDEIGDLPLDMQVKLLRLLQEKEYRPVGAVHRKKVDLRVIAATHRNLAQEVERGTFRQDLYYRLNVITLKMPPLREHKEDIPNLTDQFLSRFGTYTMTSEVMDALMHHNWPGNVRELQNCMDRMAAMNPGPELLLEDLPSAVQHSIPSPEMHGIAALANALQPKRIMPLEEMERRAIAECLEYTRGDRGTAAALLGIGRTTLYRKLKAYNLEVDEPGAGCHVQLRK